MNRLQVDAIDPQLSEAFLEHKRRRDEAGIQLQFLFSVHEIVFMVGPLSLLTKTWTGSCRKCIHFRGL